MADVIKVTVVGQDLFKIVEQKFDMLQLTMVNQVNKGMLGNLKTLTYEIGVDDYEVLRVRKELMNAIGEDNLRIEGFFKAGDWMSILVIKPLKIRD